MKIISWNCNMAFRKKIALILSYMPDILVVQECEHPDKINFDENNKPNSILWFGKNLNKGLGIFSFSNYRLRVLDIHNEAFRMIIPVAVEGGKETFNLFAIWANNPHDEDGAYIEQVWKAVHYYDSLLKTSNSILVGDFNSNVIWDRKGKECTHQNMVSKLESRGIFSIYHKYHNQQQGQELHPTLYLYRHRNRPYHIDYCFASECFKKVDSVMVGEYDQWIQYSDHMPIIITFSLK